MCGVLLQPTCSGCATIRDLVVTLLYVIAESTEVMHESLVTSPYPHCHGHTGPIYAITCPRHRGDAGTATGSELWHRLGRYGYVGESYRASSQVLMLHLYGLNHNVEQCHHKKSRVVVALFAMGGLRGA